MFRKNFCHIHICVLLFLLFLFLSVLSVFSQVAGQNEMKPDGIIIHASGCPGPQGQMGMQNKIPSDRNFHYIVMRDGKVYPGFQENRALMHIGNRMTNRSISVLVEINRESKSYSSFDDNDIRLTVQQRKSFEELLFQLMNRHDIPLSQIERHVDYDLCTDCPGHHFPYFEILYSMAKRMIASANRPLLEDICRNRGISLPLENAVLIVDKSTYQLNLFAGNVHLKSYDIGLSNQPKGDKLRRGDRRTPLGTFYICEKFPMRGWMEISYPGARHAKIGIEKNIIDKHQYDEIVACEKAGGIPWHYSPMGNDVGFHAAGFPYKRMRKDSTAGCIVLEDPEAFELFHAVPLGSKVTIRE
jgi:hypothetical protein